MEKARRSHVPAFGEWNYYSSSSPEEPELLRCGGGAAVDWWYVPEPDACSDLWFRYSPPPRKPAPKKVRRPEAGGRTPAEKLRYDGGEGSARARASDIGTAALTPGKGGGTRRMIRPVDEDLYQVPPPEFTPRRPGRKRILWMDCFGSLNCVA